MGLQRTGVTPFLRAAPTGCELIGHAERGPGVVRAWAFVRKTRNLDSFLKVKSSEVNVFTYPEGHNCVSQ